MGRWRRVLVALVPMLALSAACSSDNGPVTSARGTPTTETTTTTTTPPPPPTWPLTGMPADPAADLTIPVIAVKVDNTPQARPHVGINEADQVYELQVESITRFMELFHSQTPDHIGPVRSARSSDIDLLSNLNRPLFVWSGANPGVTRDVRAAQDRGTLVDVGEGTPAASEYYRNNRGRRDYEHTLFVNAASLRAKYTPPGSGPPPPMFSFRPAGEAVPATALDAPGIVIDFGFGVRVEYVWDAERSGWDRFQVDQLHGREQSAFVDDAGRQVSPENVVILFLPYDHSSPSPVALSVGSGSGLVLTEGKALTVTWTRENPTDGWHLTDQQSGLPVNVTPGRTWVALPEQGVNTVTPIDPAAAAALLALRV